MASFTVAMDSKAEQSISRPETPPQEPQTPSQDLQRTFNQFPLLPIELKLMIWKFAANDSMATDPKKGDQVIYLHRLCPQPFRSLLHTSKQAQDTTIKHLGLIKFDLTSETYFKFEELGEEESTVSTEIQTPYLYLNPMEDTIVLGVEPWKPGWDINHSVSHITHYLPKLLELDASNVAFDRAALDDAVEIAISSTEYRSSREVPFIDMLAASVGVNVWIGVNIIRNRKQTAKEWRLGFLGFTGRFNGKFKSWHWCPLPENLEKYITEKR